jgi:prepilin-type processing-associated H-X9-DG protein
MIWKCPADHSSVKVNGKTIPRVRSISMKAWFDSTDVAGFGPTGMRIYKKMIDLNDPGASMTWVFLDEREDSINDGEFVVGMYGYPSQPSQWQIVDFPASYHNRAAGFSFADGHAEIRRWIDSRTMPPLTKGGLNLGVGSPENQDVFWMMDHTTRKAN